MLGCSLDDSETLDSALMLFGRWFTVETLEDVMWFLFMTILLRQPPRWPVLGASQSECQALQRVYDECSEYAR